MHDSILFVAAPTSNKFKKKTIEQPSDEIRQQASAATTIHDACVRLSDRIRTRVVLPSRIDECGQPDTRIESENLEFYVVPPCSAVEVTLVDALGKSHA